MKFTFTIVFLILAFFITEEASAQIWVRYNVANSQIVSDHVSTIAFDGNGNNWIGTLDSGLVKFDGTTWTNLTSNINQVGVLALATLGSNLWVATGNGGGLQKFDGTTWSSVAPNSHAEYTNALATDNLGQLWDGNDAGLSVLRTSGTWNTFLSAQTNTHLPSDNISAVTVDNSGNIYAGFTFQFGIVKLNGSSGDGTLISKDAYPTFPDDYVTSIAIDWGGNIWAATKTSGVVKVSGSNATVYSQSTDATFIDDVVNTVTVDGCGHVWIGTLHGAAMYDGSKWTQYNKANSQLPNDTVYYIGVDGPGHIWFCTNGGLEEFKPLPQKIDLQLPTNASIVTADSTNLKWYFDCPGITKYWVEIADNPTFTNSKVDTTSATLIQNASLWDTGLVNHSTYYWKVKALNDAGWSTFSETWSFAVNIPPSAVKESSDAGFILEQNYPNPFAAATTIKIYVPNHATLSLKVFDELGRVAATIIQGEFEKGEYSIPFDLTSHNLQSGAYFYTLQSGNTTLQRAMQVIH